MGDNECYYCGMIFDSKEKLYDHVEEHTLRKEKEEKPKKKEKSVKQDSGD